MSKLTDRMDWYGMRYTTRLWIIWFLLLVAIGTLLDFIVPETYTVDWMQWLAISIICVLLSRLIIGPSKKKLNEEEE